MIKTKAQYEVIRGQLERLDSIIANFRDKLKDKHLENYALFSENYRVMRAEMLSQIEEYFSTDPATCIPPQEVAVDELPVLEELPSVPV